MPSLRVAASAIVLASFPLPAWAQAHYEPLPASSDWTLESTDGGPAVLSAMESTTWSGPAALMEGWISRWIYMRLDEDRQTYFVLVDEDAAEEKYICRVRFDGFPQANSNRDAEAALARLGALCENERRETLGAADMRMVSPGQPGGPTLGESLDYRLPDGSALTIQHIQNSGLWLPALPPEIARAPLVIGNMPTARGAYRDRHDRIWYVREENGRWGVSVHFGHGQALGRSGCYIRHASDRSRVPGEAWLSAEALDWCREKQQAYLDATPPAAELRAIAPPAPREPVAGN